MKNLPFFLLLTASIILIVSIPFLMTSSNDFEKGKQQLELSGYTEITNTGRAFFCCDEEETFSTGFSAKDKNGNIVKGCFCSTFFKGITIRFK